MTPRRHLADLDLATIVAAFDGMGDRVHASIEDDHGRCLAASNTTVTGGHRETAAIVVHDEPAGQVVLTGRLDDADLLHAAARSMAAAIAVAVAVGIEPVPATRSGADIDQELATGRRLQRSFVSLVPPDVPGYEISTYYEAAREVGGDFFDLFRLRRRGRPLSLVIADVTGKGIAAALLMAFARPILHAAIDHTPTRARRSRGPTRCSSGNDGPRCSSRPSSPAWTSPRAGSGSRTRATSRRCSSPGMGRRRA